MNNTLSVSTAVLALMMELTLRTIKKLEENGQLSTVDPTHNVALNDSVIQKQIVDSIATYSGAAK